MLELWPKILTFNAPETFPINPISIGLVFKYAKRLEITKASPAPIVSTTLLVNAGISKIFSLVLIKQPFFPVVTIKTFAFGRLLELSKSFLKKYFYHALQV